MVTECLWIFSASIRVRVLRLLSRQRPANVLRKQFYELTVANSRPVPARSLKEVRVSFVTTQPEVLSGAAGSLSGIGDAMVARNTAAAAPTTGLPPAASDIVSAMTAAQFGQQGLAYQQLAAQAAEVHEQLVATLRSGAGAYALAEAANAAAAG
jgi:hypothetical protein